MGNFHFMDPDELDKDPFAEEETEAGEFEKLLANEDTFVNVQRFRPGEELEGEVIQKGKEYLFIDLGGKKTGSLPIEQFKESTGVVPDVGEVVKAYVKSDDGSEVLLTQTLSQGEASAELLRNAYENGVPVEATIESANKGGFQAKVSGKRAFVPISHMDSVRIEEPEPYIGKTYTFHVLEFKQGGRNIVLSRRDIIKKEREEAQKTVLSHLSLDSTVRAKVTRLAQFGAFADVGGGVEGLIPLGEMAWKRISKASDVVNVGDEVLVRVKSLETEPRLRISLSLKEAGEDPWIVHCTKLNPGDVLPGKVTNLKEYGAFVSVFEGVEGMVHVSQITWEKRVNHPKEFLEVDQDVDVHVLSCDPEARRLELSIKGPMPEDMAKKLEEKKKFAETGLTAEERQQIKEWEEFKKQQKAAPRKEGDTQSALAMAFNSAKNRK